MLLYNFPGFQPGAVSKKVAQEFLGGSEKLVKRMIWATRHTADHWFEIVGNREGTPGEDVTIDRLSLESAYQRLRKGEKPPLLPSELAARQKRADGVTTKRPAKGKKRSSKNG